MPYQNQTTYPYQSDKNIISQNKSPKSDKIIHILSSTNILQTIICYKLFDDTN